MRMLSYVAYGLGVRSDLPLPELPHSEIEAKVLIRLARVAPLLEAGSGSDRVCRVAAGRAYLWQRSVGTFLVRAGREILVEPAPGVDDELLRHWLLGPALALLLDQRGCLVLHASAMAGPRGAVAFLGGPGWGKSTLAALMHARGHSVLADDVTAIHFGRGCVSVPAGVPQLKLWPDSASFLEDRSKRLRRPTGVQGKVTYGAQASHRDGRAPLRRLYVLAWGEPPGVERSTPADALVEIVRHSYGVRHLHHLDARRRFARQARLARQVPTVYLRRPPGLDALPQVARLIEADLEQDAA